ncbi:MAG: hypothetical protein F9K48_00200 [Candidatus Brocadia sp.]|nr:MAG: hypothetical protein F9K48_00200 [Candidatus Brocadia sp.]
MTESVELQEGLSVGAVWSVYQVAKEIGIEDALGKDFQGKLALWQVMVAGDRPGVKALGGKAGTGTCR